ncbi:MAG: UDP-3-O-(3-hydroxymyristoyl)glucosamine N-acyltransferase [Candidatus Aadella gelida]|nr:UDP-3-O-(3-hydroxymyristoyl)glucosamine N-acyltransferase [Candidatus Aadella gelida]
MKIAQLSGLLQAELTGDGNLDVNGMAHPDYAKEGEITFADHTEDIAAAEKSKALSFLTEREVEKSSKTVLKVKNLKIAATILHHAFLDEGYIADGKVHPTAVISETAVIGKNVSIGPNAVIGDNTHIGDNTVIEAGCVVRKDTTIGKRCYLYPNVTIYKYVELKDKVIIHSGTSIGSDGFGYLPYNGETYKVPQMGKVIIEENVEIGANSCVDRGTFGNTVIGKNTKVDNLVQIAHNVKMGKNVFLAAQVGIAGSATIGDGVMAGGQAGVADHIKVASNKKISAKCGVIGHIREQDPGEFFGFPAREAREAFRQMAFLAWLNKNSKKIMKMVKSFSER